MSVLEQRLDEMPAPRGQVLILVICLLLNLADGFDVMAMSYAAPALAADWSVAPEQLGAVFSAALVGMAVGSIFLGPLADVFGRRTMVLIAAGFVSVSMFATAACESVWQLVALRFLAGLGIGVIVPASATLATEYAPARIRNAAVVLVSAGFSVGAVAAGLMAEELISALGWEGLFMTGGAITALLFLLALFYLQESVYYVVGGKGGEAAKLARINGILAALQREPIDNLPPVVAAEQSRGNVLQLFAPELRYATIQIWLLWFAYFWASYLVVNWVPTLLVYDGYTQAQGIDALTYFTTGALIGAILLGFLSARFLLTPMIAGMLLVSGVLVALWVLVDFSFFLQKMVLGVVGFMFSASYGLFPLAAAVYAPRVRATGIGWGSGFGRTGAIVSPLITGFVVAAGWALDEMMLTLVVPPLLIATLLVYNVGRR